MWHLSRVLRETRWIDGIKEGVGRHPQAKVWNMEKLGILSLLFGAVQELICVGEPGVAGRQGHSGRMERGVGTDLRGQSCPQLRATLMFSTQFSSTPCI